MSTMIEHTPSELDSMLDGFLRHHCFPVDDDSGAGTTISHATELRQSLGLTHGPILLSGHQPIFFHPGILIKDCLLQALAKRYRGTAAALILDTDQGAIDFSWPSHSTRGWAVRRTISVAEAGRISAAQVFTPTRKDQLRNALESCLVDLSSVLSPPAAQRARPYLFHLLKSLDETDDVVEFTTSVRRFHAARHGWDMTYIRASDLIRTPAFEFFVMKIFTRPEEFRTVFNTSLGEYRKQHGITNHAQPFPNLKEDELPFWLLVNDRREPLSGRRLSEAEDQDLHTLFTEGRILPRAITLSLFLRMFVCDLFVHGTGGGRYDRVTEKVIQRFFCCQAAPHTVATATLHLEPRGDYPLVSRPLAQIALEERALQFDPVRLLPRSCFLFEERSFLTRVRSSLRGTEGRYSVPSDTKVPDSFRRAFALRMARIMPRLIDPTANPPALLDREFRHLRRLARRYLRPRATALMAERKREHICTENLRVFDDRSFPFFFYDVSAMSKSPGPYGPPL